MPDPMEHWLFGKCDIRAVLWPWPLGEQPLQWGRQWGCAGFDSMVSAGSYVEDSWTAAKWSLSNGEDHTERLRMWSRDTSEMPSSGRMAADGFIWYLPTLQRPDPELSTGDGQVQEDMEERRAGALAGGRRACGRGKRGGRKRD
mmetsp:Transcript_53758/g.109590  ORF Transcript_53758/g.109590 Transcript_53758/m.109590 type:complete len:144 (-) Transcript_53758:10-441(-)